MKKQAKDLLPGDKFDTKDGVAVVKAVFRCTAKGYVVVDAVVGNKVSHYREKAKGFIQLV
jgi:hypothetical protein